MGDAESTLAIFVTFVLTANITTPEPPPPPVPDPNAPPPPLPVELDPLMPLTDVVQSPYAAGFDLT